MKEVEEGRRLIAEGSSMVNGKEKKMEQADQQRGNGKLWQNKEMADDPWWLKKANWSVGENARMTTNQEVVDSGYEP